MDEYEATFEIDSKTDAYAVERLMDRLHDSLREETRSIREEPNDSTDMLAQFETIREATRGRSPGQLTVIYEQRDEDFEG